MLAVEWGVWEGKMMAVMEMNSLVRLRRRWPARAVEAWASGGYPSRVYTEGDSWLHRAGKTRSLGRLRLS